MAPGDQVRIAAYRLRFDAVSEATPEKATSATKETLVHGLTTSTTSLAVSEPAPGLGEMIGACEPMQRVFSQVRKLASSNVAVLLLGETGTGKELVARALHSLGPNRSGPWVAVNCAAIAPELVESELFGHERGAFTGAHRQRDGAFVAASGGTLFLDEIGEMPFGLQPKLLRVLESAEIVRVGGRQPLPISARVIAATNRNLAKDVEAGRFRKDLYYRLCVVPVTLPLLVERGDDVVLLARHFAAEEDGAGRLEFTVEALDFLRGYSWPGNVRELRNLVRRLGTRDVTGFVSAAAVREALEADRGAEAGSRPATETEEPARAKAARAEDRGSHTLRETERLAILRALQDCQGNKQAAARRLGIASATLYEKIRKYGLKDIR